MSNSNDSKPPAKTKPKKPPAQPFVRQCPDCGKLCQTADQTGKTPCSECGAPKEAKPAPAPAPAPTPETKPTTPETKPAVDETPTQIASFGDRKKEKTKEG